MWHWGEILYMFQSSEGRIQEYISILYSLKTSIPPVLEVNQHSGADKSVFGHILDT